MLDYVPTEFGALLWLNGIIDYPELIRLRGVTPLLKMEELVKLEPRQNEKYFPTTLRAP